MNSNEVEYTKPMSDQPKSFIRIRAREASDYAARGYFVIRNETYAQVEISELGASVKTGDTMAILEWDSKTEIAKAKGQISVLAKPENAGDGAKKQKKKPENEAAPVEAPVQVDAPVEPTQAQEVNVSPNKSEELEQQEDPF